MSLVNDWNVLLDLISNASYMIWINLFIPLIASSIDNNNDDWTLNDFSIANGAEYSDHWLCLCAWTDNCQLPLAMCDCTYRVWPELEFLS